jgi:hypothetical protein
MNAKRRTTTAAIYNKAEKYTEFLGMSEHYERSDYAKALSIISRRY